MKQAQFNAVLDYMFNYCEEGTPERQFVEVVHNMINLLDDNDIESQYRECEWRYIAGLED